MAAALVGSEILRIAGEIRTLVAAGRAICNLTVGDFDPRYFPIPEVLMEGIRAALEKGETNYPPSNGLEGLRAAVARFYERDLGLRYPVDSVLIAGGARPIIYCIFRTLVDPGDRVVYTVPSWNNNHYVHLVGGQGVPVVCRPEHRFLPTREELVPALSGARLLSLNSPLNPTGTAFERSALLGICEAVLEENEARNRRGERPLYLMYDQIYWMLCLRRHRPRDAAGAVAGDGALHPVRGRDQQGLRGHGTAGGLGRGAGGHHLPHVGCAGARRGLGAPGRAAGHGQAPRRAGGDPALSDRLQAPARRCVWTVSTRASRP